MNRNSKPASKPQSGKVGYGSASKGQTMAQRDKADKAYDKSHGIKQGSAADKRLDKKNGVYDYEYGSSRTGSGSKSRGKVGVGGTLSAAQRNALPSSKFGLPGKGEGKSGKGSGSYPMPDKAHAVAAKGFAKRFASPAERAKIDAKANAVLGKSGKGGK